jgi:2-oxoglutarate ferredoxin oxidoreductase subunit beta
MGSVDAPFNPLSLALGSEATFVARTLDSDRAHLQDVLRAAAEHEGSAFVEIYQNCPIFNDGAFEVLKNPETRDESIIRLQDGEPITFGDKVVVQSGYGLQVKDASEVDAADVVVHKADVDDPAYAFALSRLSGIALDHTPIGVFRNVKRPTYDAGVRSQVDEAAAGVDRKEALDRLLHSGDTWTVL